MTRGRPLLRGFIAAGLSWMLLLGAIALGMVVPRLELLSGFGAGGRLDYSAYGPGFSPLSLAFITDILGLDSPSPSTAGASGTASAASAASAGSSAAVASTSGPTEVEHPFTNDDVEGAYAIKSVPFRARTDTSGGTRSADEPSDCSPTGGTAWYRYRPPNDVALFSDTFGTGRAAALGVYSRSGSGPLELIGCDRNVVGNAQVGFPAEANTTYYFQVTSIVRGGPTVFELVEVGRTTVVTRSPSGERAEAPANTMNHPDISADGRYVLFVSTARNLASRPTNCDGNPDCDFLYLHDRLTGKTTSVASAPSPWSRSFQSTTLWSDSISAGGRFIGFTTYLERSYSGVFGFDGAPDAEQWAANTYVYDRVTKRYELVSRNSAGEAARGDAAIRAASDQYPVVGSGQVSMSSDGRYVTFTSDGVNLGGHVERGRVWNVYRRDRLTGITRLVSTDSRGRPMRANSFACTGRNLSGDGRYVFFTSTLGTGREDDVHSTRGHLYLWDASTGRTRLVTKVPQGTPVRGSYCPAISQDGSRTAFVSMDPLVPEDTNETPDVYSYKVATGRIRRVSVTSAGEQTTDANFYSTEGSDPLPRSVTLSADGRYVAFDSSAPELVPAWAGSTRYAGSRSPGPIQVYVHDHVTGATILASVSSTGEPLPGNSVVPYISGDGRILSFLNSGRWTDENSVVDLDVMVHELALFR